MGAYENPSGYIDTQTAQHFQNLQDTISNAVQTVAGSYKEKKLREKAEQEKLAEKYEKQQKEIQQLALRVGEEESALYRELSSSQIKNPTVNFEELYRPKIKEYARLRTAILNGTSTNPSEDRMTADKIYSSVATLKESLVNASAEGFLEKWNKRGTSGGYSLTGNDPNVVNGLLILTNQLPGEKVPVLDENYQVNWEIYDRTPDGKRGKLITSFNSQKIQEAVNGNGMLKVIPDAAGDLEGIKAANPAIFKLDKGIPTGAIADEFLIKGSEFNKEVAGKTTIVQNGVKYNKIEYIPSIKVNKDGEGGISSDPNFNALVDSKSAALLDGTGVNAAVFNNHFLTKQPGYALLPTNRQLNEQEIAKFKNDYKQYVLDTIPSEQRIPGSNIETVTEKAGTRSNSGNKGNTRTLTDKEILLNNLNNNYNKEGYTFANGKVKVINGKLYKVDANGFEIGDPMTLQQTRVHLGLPENGRLIVNK